MDIPEEINFSLKKPIKYSYEGEEIQGKFIILISPTRKQMKQCVFLKQEFFKAFKNLKNIADSDSEIEKGDENTSVGGQEIIALLYSNDSDMNKTLLSGIELLKSGVAKIEGVKDLTSPMIDQMTQNDLENCIGEYLANFILASIINQDS